jgi:hypothetical protein
MFVTVREDEVIDMPYNIHMYRATIDHFPGARENAIALEASKGSACKLYEDMRKLDCKNILFPLGYGEATNGKEYVIFENVDMILHDYH